jgi:hypothetical protein
MPAQLAESQTVDPKTIERLIVAGRIPYRRHRYAVAAFFGVYAHIYGMVANNAPAFHLRKIPGGDLVSTRLETFERVWESATPYEGE